MSIYDLMGSYWIVLIRLHEKFRTFNFFHCFWHAIDRNLMMADLVSQIEGVCTFFCETFLLYRIFLILRLQLRILDCAMDVILRPPFYIERQLLV
jgi:hypothetical protein